MLLNKRDAAKFLQVSTRTIDRERDKGGLRWVRVGRAIRFTAKDLERYVDRQTEEARQ